MSLKSICIVNENRNFLGNIKDFTQIEKIDRMTIGFFAKSHQSDF